MANIVVFAELRRAALTAPSRFALGEARRVASQLGATVYTLLTMPPAEEARLEGHARTLGEAGADRILCCVDPALGGPLLDGVVGPLLAGLTERLRPMLCLFPAGAVGAALGPSLAIRTGAAYHPRATLELARPAVGAGLRLQVRRFRPGDGAARTLELGPGAPPVVATLVAGRPGGRLGEPTTEVEMLAFVSPPAGAAVRELAAELDDQEDLELASALVAVAGNAGPGELAALRAAVPPGMVVVAPGERRAALDLACPARVLVLGGSAPTAALARRVIAPGARVAVAGPRGAEKAVGRADVVWRTAGRQGMPAMAAALREAGEEGGP